MQKNSLHYLQNKSNFLILQFEQLFISKLIIEIFLNLLNFNVDFMSLNIMILLFK